MSLELCTQVPGQECLFIDSSCFGSLGFTGPRGSPYLLSGTIPVCHPNFQGWLNFHCVISKSANPTVWQESTFDGHSCWPALWSSNSLCLDSTHEKCLSICILVDVPMYVYHHVQCLWLFQPPLPLLTILSCCLSLFHKSTATTHGLLLGHAPECQQHINDYFDTGIVQFVDGEVCGAEFPDASILWDGFKSFI